MTLDLRTRLAVLVLVASLLSLGACGGADGDLEPEIDPNATRIGQIYDLVLASTAADADGDRIPDDVETHALVGTDPNESDSDGDGRFDCFEVFGRSFLFVVSAGKAGELHASDTLLKRNGRLAALDPQELADVLMHDSDQDGIYDYLEYYGYVYDWPTASFVAWTQQDREAFPDIPWYRTDPLQFSTDQDAYSDGMEASGLNMDVAVSAPGTHPLVPAYPNIVVRLCGYSVTLNEDVSYERGGSIEKEHSWSRETERSSEFGWSTGGEAGLELGFEGDSFNIMGHYNQSWGIEGSNSTSTTVAIGGGVTTATEWNQARSYNPSEAARIKLLLKVENVGLAPASNLVPTVSLRIGGADVLTFEQSEFQIHMLMPGEVYPAADDVYWVVDSTANGPLTLTDWELKALECGAPVSIAVTQLAADVMRLEDGMWEGTGDVNEYVARCEAVSASLFADLGDGDFLQRRVYAGEGPTAPVVTLADAVRWGLGGVEDDGGWSLEYRDARGDLQSAQLDGEAGVGWTIHTDRELYEQLSDDAHPFSATLSPRSRVQFIPPRGPQEQGPRVFSAYATPMDNGYDVVVCACDYDGIESVVFVDRDGAEIPLSQDGRGPWFYSCQVPSGYDFSGYGLEVVKVTSVNDAVPPAEYPVHEIHTVVAQPALILSMRFDEQRETFETHVERGGDMPEEQIAWIRLYHSDFLASQTGEDRDGYVTLEETVNWFELPDRYECGLPFSTVPDDARLVACTAGGLYAVSGVGGMDVLKPYRQGSATLLTWTDTPDFSFTPYWRFDAADLDGGTSKKVTFDVTDRAEYEPPTFGPYYHTFASDWRNAFTFGTTYDVCYKSNGYFGIFGKFATQLRFLDQAAMAVDTGLSEKGANAQYLEMSYADVSDLMTANAGALVMDVAVGKGTLIVFRTGDDRLGKLIVRARRDSGPYGVSCASELDVAWVVFRKSTDDVDPPASFTYRDDGAVYSVGKAIPPNRPQIDSGGVYPDSYSIYPSLPYGGGLTLNAGSGVITGTPTLAMAEKTYDITGKNGKGTSTTQVTFTVLQPPSGLTYPASTTVDIGATLAIAAPSVSGAATSFSISPALPAGITIDPDDGSIGGSTLEVTKETTYTVTARNVTMAFTTAKLKLTTELVKPDGLSYSPASGRYRDDAPITPIKPTVTGLAANPAVVSAHPLSFSASNLPPGITIDTSTGVISGTPTQPTYTYESTTYVGSVTVSNSKGSVTLSNFRVEIYNPDY